MSLGNYPPGNRQEHNKDVITSFFFPLPLTFCKDGRLKCELQLLGAGNWPSRLLPDSYYPFIELGHPECPSLEDLNAFCKHAVTLLIKMA